MSTPLLYRIAQTLVRAAMGIYFKKLEISGLELIPEQGPVIVAANHPQSGTDAFVLAVRAPRMVHYLAHSGLFDNRIRACLLRNLGVIPVHRKKDVEAAAEKNIDMFAACEQLLERGGVIGIFPEGISAEDRHLQKLKTGAARIALETESKNNWTLGLTIVPAGLSFESRRRMRTRVLLRFGPPLIASNYRQAYEEDTVEAVYTMTTDLQGALRNLVVNIERPQFEQLVNGVERIYKNEVVDRLGTVIEGETQFKKGQSVSQEIPRALDFFLERRPEVVWRIDRLLRKYHRKLNRLRLRDEMLSDKSERTVHLEATKLVFWGALGLPLALYGALWNFVPYKLTGWLARRTARDTTIIHYNQLSKGFFIYLLYYGPLLYLAYLALGLPGAAIFGATLPPTGLFARAYTRFMARRQRMLRFAFFRVAHRYYVQTLRQQREILIDEMDHALKEYLAERHVNDLTDTTTNEP